MAEIVNNYKQLTVSFVSFAFVYMYMLVVFQYYSILFYSILFNRPVIKELEIENGKTQTLE